MRIVHNVVPVLAVVLGVGLAGLANAPAGHAAAASPAGAVSVSPSPGDQFATPQTTISFRGATPATLGTVVVTGSRSGNHAGSLVADPDGATIWKPRAAFDPGERVTVHTGVPVAGATGDSFSFTVAHIAPHR